MSSIDNREIKRFLQDFVKILECAKYLASTEYAPRNSFILYILNELAFENDLIE